ncbi:beta-galactosidase/beta-glucuronidase [Streptomyces sp. AK010]|nr:beta-galactosidase/beta-glucuronidase [Streptomyces sp. AK010]
MQPPVHANVGMEVPCVPDASETASRQCSARSLTVEARGVRDGVPITATAYDGRRKVATASGRTGRPLTLTLHDPHLWSPDDPFLYRLEVKAGADRVGSQFGMRSIAVKEIDGVPRTVLNGTPVFMMATVDQGFRPDGLHTAPTDEALAYDLKAHKRLGFNSVRKHIKVEPDRWFYWADRLGLLVWQDMPAMTAGVNPSAASRARYEREMKEMIDEHGKGSSGAVYTQIADVEGELNGFLTYDRAVLKPDTAKLRAAHEALIRAASRVTPTGCPAAQPVLN